MKQFVIISKPFRSFECFGSLLLLYVIGYTIKVPRKIEEDTKIRIHFGVFIFNFLFCNDIAFQTRFINLPQNYTRVLALIASNGTTEF